MHQQRQEREQASELVYESKAGSNGMLRVDATSEGICTVCARAEVKLEAEIEAEGIGSSIIAFLALRITYTVPLC